MSVFLREGKGAVLASLPPLASVLTCQVSTVVCNPYHIEWGKRGMGGVGGGDCQA